MFISIISRILSVASLRTRCYNFLWIIPPVPITCCYSCVSVFNVVSMYQGEHQNINLHVWINLLMLPVFERFERNKVMETTSSCYQFIAVILSLMFMLRLWMTSSNLDWSKKYWDFNNKFYFIIFNLVDQFKLQNNVFS